MNFRRRSLGPLQQSVASRAARLAPGEPLSRPPWDEAAKSAGAPAKSLAPGDGDFGFEPERVLRRAGPVGSAARGTVSLPTLISEDGRPRCRSIPPLPGQDHEQ